MKIEFNSWYQLYDKTEKIKRHIESVTQINADYLRSLDIKFETLGIGLGFMLDASQLPPDFKMPATIDEKYLRETFNITE